jgi:glutaredoxin|tara:strand:- start:1511 stop:1771 length:261 start_codon:yes stop_codon:yes gene_type:complete
MDIRVYLYDTYDPYSVKILELLKSCNLKFAFNTYSEDNMDYISQEIGNKVRKLPQVVVDGNRIGGYYDLMELLLNKKLIDYKGNPC